LQEKILNNLTILENKLKGYKKIYRIRQFLKKLLEKYDIEFVILFGSIAKNNWNYRSDIDLLIVSNSIKGDYLLRLRKMQQISPRGIDFFIYTLEEYEKMLNEFRLMAIEPLSTGILIYDKGLGAKFIEKVKNWIKVGKITKVKNGWKIMM